MDKIEHEIEIAAPVERVWRALTDHREFGRWFKADIDGPFEIGSLSTGRITYPGFEHLAWEARITAMEPMHLFTLDWPPFYGDDLKAGPDDPWTHVEFRLLPSGAGTRLRMTESGFNALPPDRRGIAFRMNEGGWGEQMENVRRHAEATLAVG